MRRLTVKCCGSSGRICRSTRSVRLCFVVRFFDHPLLPHLSSTTYCELVAKPTTSSGAQRSLALAQAAAQVAVDLQGQDVVILDMRDQTTWFDYFVIATGTSRRQLHAMSEEIDHKLEDDLHDERMGIEGYRESRWIVLDYGTVVIHLFDEETRRYYSLETLWGDARRIPLDSVSN